jgi:UDP-N-acetyl-D-galactosamine dehydrogenase
LQLYLGYVGLPLARLFATRHAVGFDINQSRVAELKSGIDTTLEIDTTTLQKVLVEKLGHDKGLYCTTALDEIKECNYYIVTVPTPVDKTIVLI